MFNYTDIQNATIYHVDSYWYSDNKFVNAIMGIESGHIAYAYNTISGAKGLFQFVSSTAQYYNLKDAYDPHQSLKAFKKLTADNIRVLLKSGIPVTPVNIYLCHQQGAGGFKKLYKHINCGAPISETLLRNIKNNSLGGFKSVKQFYADWEARITREMNK